LWIKSYIGIGSNLGDRRKNIQLALNVLKEKKDIIVEKVSPFYETLPVGGPPRQGKFLNGVIEISTTLTPQELLKVLQEIEKALGRVRKERWGPRTIDLDILFYGDLIVNEERLIIPHPLMHKREFVLKPLLRIAPDLIHPVLKKSVKELLDQWQSF
jgi:2-amino-4-hydroxy-6-hydroxymethyldihydropteridine diphosphokinase